MNLPFVQKIWSKNLLPRIRKILLLGGQGDALYCRDLIDIIHYFKTENPEIQIVLTTNGSHKNEKWWRQLAQVLNQNDCVVFSVDGWDHESNKKYRVNSDFESILNGMKTLKKYNEQVYLIWSAIVFRFNQHHLDKIQELARTTGVDAFNVVFSSLFGSWYPHYIDPKLNDDPLEPEAHLVSAYQNSDRGLFISLSKRSYPPSINPLIKQFVGKYINTYKEGHIMPMCRIGERGLYVDAEGIIYPCSWVSHPFGSRQNQKGNKTIWWKESLWVQHKDQFNLHKHSLESILKGSLWKSLFESWQDDEKSFVECENKCHQSQSSARIARIDSREGANGIHTQDQEIMKAIHRYKDSIAEKAQQHLIFNRSPI